ncbi:hypothetical protein [Agrobacterium tumefaciens]|uniref:Uncharacterized protein n=1 Tax=Agrobacterium tumefaciens TaxID=358 RepID=A0AA44F8H6_AGRTU|nr:hypothetical protein [Agrobacterium tumefaciens]NSL21750.1 hypothetical protein [Agrobacterium tumefaciens]NTB85521.1 hypothetical protein [Agrobacterium tumefaciens]NTC18858.1 hypothetical protein [Agrobacterium tumefaciens]NTC30848.1 hypothetical protein [Agrobacterium tumefaciens]NTC55712.1 hypothetical protein [Agrobacterium tumefaciens]
MNKELIVKGLSGDEGRSDLVRLNYQDRDARKFPRWCVAKLTCGERSRYVVVLGQDNNPGYIELDFDHRNYFGVEKDDKRIFKLKRAGLWGNIVYMLTAHDPMLRLPAIISVVSFFLGVVSMIPMFIEFIGWARK